MKGILITILSILTGICTTGQIPLKAIIVDNIESKHINHDVTIGFTLYAGDKATTNNYNLVVHPVLLNETDSLNLPLIIIQGRNARIAEERYILATGQANIDNSYYLDNGESVAYTATVPFQAWMEGADLDLQGMSIGCCSATEVTLGNIAQNLLGKTEVIEEVPVEQPTYYTTADQLANKYPFLSSIENYDRSGSRDGALTIYFRQGKRIIDRAYKDNNRSLVELVSAVRAIQSSTDSRIVRILIAGYASPEGAAAFNEQLAGDRAAALKQFLFEYTALRQDQIQMHNGAVDWAGLRKLVAESGMYEKQQILDIIDNTPLWDSDQQRGRLGRLMNLNGGEPYRYMLNNFFPLLRNAAYIKVYYENL